ncbi:hypothetical protein PVAND_007088 [Polypedilum vanderplanki]|uniref:Uncharacterized protein n=1 Tax=Polypedilum vanderplanki TaxID=319348 RepID=A0A9J6C5Q7_POLVA|nr:hypothetical protein PVAND_007088 [Polypedilum vanderplanki]
MALLSINTLRFLLFLALGHLTILSCHPIFPFDYFFETSQITTPESVISDYRHNKRTDSSFDHNNLVKNATEEMEAQYKESNAEFYAGVIGKLIGSVRSSFINLFDDVKMRNQHFRAKSQQAEAQKKKTEELNNSISIIMKHLKKNITNITAEESTEKIKERIKNDRFLNENNDKVGEGIPIKYNILDTDYLNDDYYATTAINDNALYTTPQDDNWFSKYYDYFKQQHHIKKTRKIQKFLKLILTPVLLLNETNSNFQLDRELTFDIIHNNKTIAQLTPLEIVRILHKESNDRIQIRMKSILKKIVYKYTRLYLIARRNFKKSYGSYQNGAQRDNLKILNSISEDENDISDDEDLIDEDDDFEFTTSDGRKSFKTIESLAILLLEIFGALYALGIGFWAHLEGGFFYDLLD